MDYKDYLKIINKGGMILTAGYVRLSDEDRNKLTPKELSRSIKNQISLLKEYAEKQGWTIYKFYIDEDYTGASRTRPAFNELLKDAEEHKFNIVLCKSQSRFTRELELVEKYIHGLFPIWGIRFVSIVDNADTDVKGNKKSRQINGLVNEWYLEDLSENLKSTLTNVRKAGKHIGAFALYGYKKDPKQKGHLIIDEPAAQVVRMVFDLFADGYGKTAIARILNEKGIPNPTEYKRLSGLRYKLPPSKYSTLWKYFSISSMLVNEMYIGNMVQGKYESISYKTGQNKPRPKEKWIRVENTHKPIIEKELWDKVQQLIKQKSKPFDTGKIGLFAGKARCVNCGYTLRSSKNKDYRYLQCETRNVCKDACVGAFIPYHELEQIVFQEFKKLVNQFQDNDYIEKNLEFSNNYLDEIEKCNQEIKRNKDRSELYTKSITDLYLDKTQNIISEDEFLELSKEMRESKNKIDATIKLLNEKIDELKDKINLAKTKKEVITQYTEVEKLDRNIVEFFIDYINVGRRNPKTKDVPIEIHWNF